MNITIHYYSFTDPITATTTKDVGWSASKSRKNIKVKDVNGVATVTKNQSTTVSYSFVPSGATLTTLTLGAFNALDVTGESLRSQLRRERRKAMLVKLAALPEPDDSTLAADTAALLQDYIDAGHTGIPTT